MASFDRITVGQTLYSVERQRAGNTTMTRQAIFTVKVIEIDTENRKAFMSWNGNTPQWYREDYIKRLRVKKPERKKEWWER